MDVKNLRITVNDNPNQGPCSITDHFKENWRTGITEIDTIETQLNPNAEADGIFVTEKDTGNVVFELQGQKALLLNELADALIQLLKIQISDR